MIEIRLNDISAEHNGNYDLMIQAGHRFNAVTLNKNLSKTELVKRLREFADQIENDNLFKPHETQSKWSNLWKIRNGTIIG